MRLLDFNKLSFAKYNNGIVVIRTTSRGKSRKRIIFNEHYEKVNRTYDGTDDEPEPFGGVDLDINVMKYSSHTNDIISSGYVIKGRTHPRDVRLDKFELIGSGVHGVISHSTAPDTIDIDLKNFFYVKGPRGKLFFENLSIRTNNYLHELIEAEGKHNDKKLELLAVGWNLMLMSDFIPTSNQPDFELMDENHMRKLADWWYRRFILQDKSGKSKFVNLRIPESFVPAFVNVVMANRGYKSLVLYNGPAIIYPPYVKGSKVVWEAEE